MKTFFATFVCDPKNVDSAKSLSHAEILRKMWCSIWHEPSLRREFFYPCPSAHRSHTHWATGRHVANKVIFTSASCILLGSAIFKAPSKMIKERWSIALHIPKKLLHFIICHVWVCVNLPYPQKITLVYKFPCECQHPQSLVMQNNLYAV